jgi:hypothetical protein
MASVAATKPISPFVSTNPIACMTAISLLIEYGQCFYSLLLQDWDSILESLCLAIVLRLTSAMSIAPW